MTAVTFTVVGDPAPKGSKTRMPSGAMLDAASPAARAKLANWQAALATAAHDQADLTGCMSGALAAVVTFRHAMPKSRPKTTRARGWAYKTSAPDLDKLERTLGDALKAGGLISDDAIIACWVVTKIEVWERWTGAAVTLTPLDEGKAADVHLQLGVRQ